MGKIRVLLAGLAALVFLCSGSSVCATERHFAFAYEVTTAEKGELELENWVTWQFHRGREGGPSSHRFNFRHELEYGITDRLQASLYFAEWHISDHPGA